MAAAKLLCSKVCVVIVIIFTIGFYSGFFYRKTVSNTDSYVVRVDEDETTVGMVTRRVGIHKILDDFKTYPCLSGVVPSSAIKQLGSCVRTVKKNPDDKSVEDKCVPLNITVTTPICIYDPEVDIYISGKIVRKGHFEGDMVKDLMNMLMLNPKFEFLDIGCNIGIYTLIAAKLGRRVVSVDPLTENIRLLSKSLHLGNIGENVTLIWNALSDCNSVVSFTRRVGSVGLTSIKSLNASENVVENDVAETILLDDIKDRFIGKQIVIKMDVERHELEVLKGGTLFFEQIDVQMVQMEFGHHTKSKKGKGIAEFMDKRHFKPFRDPFGKTSLKKKYATWPHDVYFLKQTRF